MQKHVLCLLILSGSLVSSSFPSEEIHGLCTDHSGEELMILH